MEDIIMKEIPNFPNYYITADGQVWSGWRKKFIKINGNGQEVMIKNERWNNGCRHVCLYTSAIQLTWK
jgi:hypothetical protein